MGNQPKLPRSGQKPAGGGKSAHDKVRDSMGAASKKQHGGVHGTERRSDRGGKR